MWNISQIKMDRFGDEMWLSFPHNLELYLYAGTIEQLGVFLCNIKRSDDPEMDVELLPPKNWGDGRPVDGGTLYTMHILRPDKKEPHHTIDVWENAKKIQILNKLKTGEVYESIELSRKEWTPIEAFLLWLQEQSAELHQGNMKRLEQQIYEKCLALASAANQVLLPPALNDMNDILFAPRH